MARAGQGPVIMATTIMTLLLTLLASTAGGQEPAREVRHIHGLALDAKDLQILYVATHFGLVRIRSGHDAEWVGEHRLDLMGFTAPSGEPGTFYASGHPDLPTYRREGVGNLGLLVSRDSGKTWRSIALKGSADFHALAHSPRAGGEVYGWNVMEQPGLWRILPATGDARRLSASGLNDVHALAASPQAGGQLLAGTKSGLMVSRDGGASWARSQGLGPDAPITAISFHGNDGNVAYAYAARPGPGLVRSGDGGRTWTRTGFPGSPDHVAVGIALGPNQEVAVATSSADVFRSDDGGASWKRILERGRR